MSQKTEQKHNPANSKKTKKAFERIIKVTDNVLEIVQSIYLTLFVEVVHCLEVL